MKSLNVKIVESWSSTHERPLLSIRSENLSGTELKRGLVTAGFQRGDEAVILHKADFEALQEEAKIQRQLCDQHRVVHEAGAPSGGATRPGGRANRQGSPAQARRPQTQPRSHAMKIQMKAKVTHIRESDHLQKREVYEATLETRTPSPNSDKPAHYYDDLTVDVKVPIQYGRMSIGDEFVVTIETDTKGAI